MISPGETWSNEGEREGEHIGETATRISCQTRFVNELYVGQSRETLISDNRVEERLNVSINNSELLSKLNPFNKKIQEDRCIYLFN